MHHNFAVVCLPVSYNKNVFNIDSRALQNSQSIRPDGDVELSAAEVEHFFVPSCPKCSGILKPLVVFFGDNVPKMKVSQTRQLVNVLSC